MTAEEKLLKIEDLVLDLSRKISQASFVQQEVTENYFDKWQPMKEKDHRYYVAYEFNRYGNFSDIVGEKIHAVEQQLEEIKKIIEASDEVSKATTHEKEFQTV